MEWKLFFGKIVLRAKQDSGSDPVRSFHFQPPSCLITLFFPPFSLQQKKKQPKEGTHCKYIITSCPVYSFLVPPEEDYLLVIPALEG